MSENDETGRFRLRDPATWPDHDLRRFPQDPDAQQPWEDRAAWYLRREQERNGLRWWLRRRDGI